MKAFISLLTLLLCYSSLSCSQDAAEIVRKADNLMKGESNYSIISMTIHRPKWERTLEMKSWAKGDDFALLYISHPAKEKGQVFLKRDKDMWNWLPGINRTIKIPASMMMQSWMGSDLTNDDLVNQSSIVNDYTHKIVEKENLDGKMCYKIELIPHENAPVVWGKIITWITVNENFTLKNEYYNEEGVLINTELMSNIKDIGDRTIPTKFRIIPEKKKDYYTLMEFKEIQFNLPIEDSFFSMQNMKLVN